MRVEAPVGQELLGLVGELQLQVALLEELPHPFELDGDDATDVVPGKLVVDDHVVDAVQELRLELGPQGLHHPPLHLLRLVRVEIDDVLAADVGRQDQHGVAEIDGAPVTVGETPVVEDLQQCIEDVRMGLLDLVEEHHAIGAPSHRLGEEPSLVIANVAGRRADQPRHRVLLHELAHVETHHGLLVVEEELGQRAHRLGLSHARGAEEDERADRSVRILESRPGAAHRVRQCGQGFVLSDHPLAQLLLDLEELLLLPFHHLADRDTRPLGDDLGDLLGRHLLGEE